MWEASIELRWSLIGSRERYSYDNGLFSCRVFTVSDDVQRTHNSFSNSFLEQHTRRWRSCFFSTARPTGPLFYRTRCGRDLITWGLSNEMDVLREFENSTVDTRKKKTRPQIIEDSNKKLHKRVEKKQGRTKTGKTRSFAWIIKTSSFCCFLFFLPLIDHHSNETILQSRK